MSVAATFLVLGSLGCRQASSPVEEREKHKGMEQAGREEPRPETNPDAGTSEAGAEVGTSQATAERGSASQEEWIEQQGDITLKEFRALDERNSFDSEIIVGLLECQIDKYRAENGQQALNRFIEEDLKEMEDLPSREIAPMQEAFIREGYSCTEGEALSAL